MDPGASETLIIQSPSNDDLSQSLSEYTDADESISAPTELLAEVGITSLMMKLLFILNFQMYSGHFPQFLSAVMLRDYVSALKYCKLSKSESRAMSGVNQTN